MYYSFGKKFFPSLLNMVSVYYTAHIKKYLVIHDGTHAENADVNVVLRLPHVEPGYVPRTPLDTGTVFQFMQGWSQASVIQLRGVADSSFKKRGW